MDLASRTRFAVTPWHAIVLAAAIICAVGAISMPIIVLLPLGLTALWIGMRAPIWAFYLYMSTIFLFQVPVLSETAVAIPTLSAVFFLVSLIIFVVMNRERVFVWSTVPGWLLAFGFFTFLSAIAKPAWFLSHPRGLLTIWGLCFLSYCTAYILRDAKGLVVVTWILNAGIALVVGLAIYESFTGNYNKFHLFDTQEERAYGLADPNYTGALIVTLLPFILMSLVLSEKKLWRALALILLIGACAGLAMTESRGAIIGLGVVSSAVVLFLPGASEAGQKRRYRTGLKMVALLLLIVVCVGVAATLAPEGLWDRLATWDKWTDPQKEARLRIWSFYLDQWRRSPIWGFGPGYLDETYLDGRQLSAHNSYVQMLLEVGLLGTVVFLLLNIAACIELLRSRRVFIKYRAPKLAVLSSTVLASLIGFLVTAFFLTSSTHKELWFLIGTSAAIRHYSHVFESHALQQRVA
jgi:O-antigen ligase